MPNTIITSHTAKKMKNKTLAIDAAPAAISVNPKTAAIIAIIKNANDQRNIVCNLWLMNTHIFKIVCQANTLAFSQIVKTT